MSKLNVFPLIITVLAGFASLLNGCGNAGRVNQQNPLDFAQRKF
jgi:hypothetical protein